MINSCEIYLVICRFVSRFYTIFLSILISPRDGRTLCFWSSTIPIIIDRPSFPSNETWWYSLRWQISGEVSTFSTKVIFFVFFCSFCPRDTTSRSLGVDSSDWGANINGSSQGKCRVLILRTSDRGDSSWNESFSAKLRFYGSSSSILFLIGFSNLGLFFGDYSVFGDRELYEVGDI